MHFSHSHAYTFDSRIRFRTLLEFFPTLLGWVLVLNRALVAHSFLPSSSFSSSSSSRPSTSRVLVLGVGNAPARRTAAVGRATSGKTAAWGRDVDVLTAHSDTSVFPADARWQWQWPLTLLAAKQQRLCSSAYIPTRLMSHYVTQMKECEWPH